MVEVTEAREAESSLGMGRYEAVALVTRRGDTTWGLVFLGRLPLCSREYGERGISSGEGCCCFSCWAKVEEVEVEEEEEVSN